MSTDDPRAAQPGSQPAAVSQEQFNQLSQQVVEISQHLSALASAMTAGKVSQAAFAQAQPPPVQPSPYAAQIPQFMQAPVAPPQQQAYYPQQLTPAQAGYVEPHYYVRIKPFNKQRGHVRTRQFVRELGRPINGGTGQPGSIPEWVRVSPDIAMSMSIYKQNEEDPMSPPVFDIVTEHERQRIDQAEAQLRAASMGLAGFTPQAIMQTAQQAGQLTAQVAQGAMPPQMPAQRPVPSMMNGAEAYMQQPQQMAPPSMGVPPPPVAPAAPAVQGGRAAALEGLPAVPPPPVAVPAPAPPPEMEAVPRAAAPAPPPIQPIGKRGVSEDITGEAFADVGAAKAIELAEQAKVQAEARELAEGDAD